MDEIGCGCVLGLTKSKPRGVGNTGFGICCCTDKGSVSREFPVTQQQQPRDNGCEHQILPVEIEAFEQSYLCERSILS